MRRNEDRAWEIFDFDGTDEPLTPIDLLMILAVLSVVVALMFNFASRPRTDEADIKTEYLTATAGITSYMGYLQKHCFEGATADAEVIENYVASVEASNETVESDKKKDAEEEVIEEPTVMVDVNEQEILAHIIYCEAGNQSELCKYYTGSVVLNRVKSDLFPNDIQSVVFQKGQYACTWNGGWQKWSDIPDDCWEIAEDLIVNGSRLPDNVIFQAEFSQGSGIYVQEGNQKFCYL